MKKVEVVRVPGDSISKEGGGKGVGAQRLTKEAHSGGDFSSEGGGGTRDKALNVGEGVVKAEGVVGERLRGIPNGNAGGCGHEFGFAVIEVCAQGSTFLFNETKDGDDVSWVEAGRGVIKVRHGMQWPRVPRASSPVRCVRERVEQSSRNFCRTLRRRM